MGGKVIKAPLDEATASREGDDTVRAVGTLGKFWGMKGVWRDFGDAKDYVELEWAIQIGGTLKFEAVL